MLAWSRTVNVVISLLFYLECTSQLSCKSERNGDVDWFVNYKLPKIDTEPEGTNLGDGTAYAYITDTGSDWKLSSKSIASGSMLENTLNQVYPDKENLAYIFYNDEAPKGFSGTAVGHLKGVVAFDDTTGFWLIHSIPKCCDDEEFSYPDNALNNGQSILCVTFRTEDLNEICNQLLFSNPNIYSYGISEEIEAILDVKAMSLFSKKPAFIKKDPLTRTAELKSLANKPFISFAKDNQHRDDLYSGLIAPGLEESLVVETWRRGSGTMLLPWCETDYSVLDIVSINMTVTDKNEKKSVFFKYTQDHSKWAISQAGGKKWICIADMNRMFSQEKRGGGALCFSSTPVWKAYNSIIAETEQCGTV